MKTTHPQKIAMKYLTVKKIFPILAISAVTAMSISSSGQVNNDVGKLNSSLHIVNLPSSFSNKKTFETKVINVNIKAVRDFIRSYKNVSDARWFKTEGGYIANFLSKGIDTRIVYDDKGGCLYSLLTYTEDNMPFAVRNLVKSQYYDDEIIVVFQYELKDEDVYIIRMKDKQSNVKVLRVCDDEVGEIAGNEMN